MLAAELRAKAASAVTDGWKWQAAREYERATARLHAAATVGDHEIDHRLSIDYSSGIYGLVRGEVLRRLREDGCEIETYPDNDVLTISFRPPKVPLAIRIKKWWNS